MPLNCTTKLHYAIFLKNTHVTNIYVPEFNTIMFFEVYRTQVELELKKIPKPDQTETAAQKVNS